MQPSFGFGDRLGLATPGHLDALRAHGGPIQPIFAQQSIREMNRTQRKPSQVLEDAQQALRSARYQDAWGADADHIKTQEDINATAGAGFVYFTIDPSDHVNSEADRYSSEELHKQFQDVRDDANWADDYLGRQIRLSKDLTFDFDVNAVRRLAVKYGRAISHAIKLSEHIDRIMTKREAAYEIELSVDETPNPLTPIEHYVLGEQCLQSGMKLASVAPRFAERFESGVDFRGDLDAFRRRLSQHALVAQSIGPYKLSLHSGSDKFSLYETFAKVTGGLFHIKTAGSSYLEALRVAARRDGRLFRRIIEFSRKRFEADRDTYLVSAELKNAPTPGAISDDAQLEKYYLDQDDGRQILHVSFGSVLTDTNLGALLRDVLEEHPDLHRELLAEHFGKHLRALRRGL